MRALALFALAIGLAGCMAGTPYKPADDRYGFRETKIEDDRYRVTFAGNNSTSRETVETYLLYRAAELTVDNGADYFRIADRDTEAKTEYFGSGVAGSTLLFRRSHQTFGGYTRGFAYGLYPVYPATPATAVPATQYKAFADVILLSGEKPEGDATAYDAAEVLKNLGPKIQRPKPEKN